MAGIVINKQGLKVEFVVLNEDKSPLFYTLNDDEQIIEIGCGIANSMLNPMWDGSEWVETATDEEIEANKTPQIDICPEKTIEERLADAEQKLAESEEEKKLFKAQVEATASSYEFLESCMMEMAQVVYA